MSEVGIDLNCVACQCSMCVEHDAQHMAEVLAHQESQGGARLFDISEEDALRRERRKVRSSIRQVHGPHRSGH